MKLLHVVKPSRIGNRYYSGRDDVISQALKLVNGQNIVYKKTMFVKVRNELIPYPYEIVDYTGDWDLEIDSDWDKDS
jgi:hypothetical protein